MSRTQDKTAATPLLEHISELRTHLVWVGIFVIGGAVLAYIYRDILLKYLQAPLGETLYYTSPTGGIAFLFKICIVGGFIFALPAILYHAFRFIMPVMDAVQRKGTTKYIIWSFFLAYAGIAFAYFFSLPSALKFLTSFGGENVQSLIDAGMYFNFALAYVGGFAFLFQLPLVVLFINRIKPLKPGGMMKFQKWVILGSYIIAAMLTPTPDPINQTLMAVPIILLYEISIVLIFFLDRKLKKQQKRLAKVALKLERKAAKRDSPKRSRRTGRGSLAIPQLATPVERPTILSALDLKELQTASVPTLAQYDPAVRLQSQMQHKRSQSIDGFSKVTRSSIGVAVKPVIPQAPSLIAAVINMDKTALQPIGPVRGPLASSPRMSPRMSRPAQVVARQQVNVPLQRSSRTMIGNDFC